MAVEGSTCRKQCWQCGYNDDDDDDDGNDGDDDIE